MATTRAIEMKTALPGPRSKAVLDRIAAAVAAPLAITFPLVIEDGRGATLTDLDGNTFIDFTGGIGCLNVGHSLGKVVAAAQEQLEHFGHTDFTVIPYEVYATLERALKEKYPGISFINWAEFGSIHGNNEREVVASLPALIALGFALFALHWVERR